LPVEVLEFLVRTTPSRTLWKWLNENAQSQLRFRIIQGFRASTDSLRQPVVRTRLVSHLQNSEGDFKAILQLWEESTPSVLCAVRELDDDALMDQRVSLQSRFGHEAVTLALLHEERESI